MILYTIYYYYYYCYYYYYYSPVKVWQYESADEHCLHQHVPPGLSGVSGRI
jgi:hypothetical protein